MSKNTILNDATILTLLGRHFQSKITARETITLGQTTHTERFHVGEAGYILRISTSDGLPERFLNERFVAERFASPQLPIPAFIALDQYKDYDYAITVAATGDALEMLPRADVTPYIPAIIAISEAMRLADVSGTSGYGWLNAQTSDGRFDGWASHLRMIADEEPEEMFYGKWHRMFEETLLERDVFERYFAQMDALLSYCPETRYLVHGNLSLPNIIGQHGRVTAVVDWADARYGDFLFDVACLNLWYSELNFAQQFHDFYAQSATDVTNFDQRVLCYQLYIGIDALRFFAKINDARAYAWIKGRLAALTA